jgi:branched-chain amino acid transport system ATP-binding protein
MRTRIMDSRQARGATDAADPFILRTEGLTRSFRGFTAVRNVSLNVRRGSIHALIGPNGAGKTTIFNLLTKFLSPNGGTIYYEGRDITALNAARVARMGLVRSFQISATFPTLTVLENVRIPLQHRIRSTFNFWRPAKSLDRLNERAMALLDDVGLASLAQTPASDLPYGRKRALELATTLALDPTLLLLDEPTAGMGHEDIARITQLIGRIAASRTVLLVEHNLSVVADLSDRITVVQRGEVLADGTYDEVSKDPRVREAYMGTDDDDD